jgi:hypothetical protein
VDDLSREAYHSIERVIGKSRLADCRKEMEKSRVIPVSKKLLSQARLRAIAGLLSMFVNLLLVSEETPPENLVKRSFAGYNVGPLRA